MLSAEASAEQGKWSTDRAPFQRGMMDAVNEDGVERIVYKTSAQVGKTEALLNIVGYFIHHDPSPMLYIQPTIDFAQDFSKDRLDSMIRDTPALRSRVSARKSKDTSNTLLKKKFRGGHITLAGANSPASLAGRPIRIVLCDEKDRYPKTAGDEGDPTKLAQKRATTFHNRLFVEVSTPTTEGSSAIEESWQESDQRKYFVPCPLCDHYQTLEWSGLKWDKGPNDVPINPRYKCVSCEGEFNESKKYLQLLKGKWVAGKPFNGTAGFHLSELYSPWRKWIEIIKDFYAAKDNPDKLRVWVNTSLGETFKTREGDQPDWEKLLNNREPYNFGEVHPNVIMITAGCDVQKDRLEVEVVGWCADKQSYSLEYLTFFGDTSLKDSACYQELEKLLGRMFKKNEETMLPIALLAIDSGFNTQTVYNWARQFPPTRVMVTKGQATLTSVVGAPKDQEINMGGRKIRRGIKLWGLGVNLLKSELYGLLKLPRPEVEGEPFRPGFCHFPQYGEEYFKQLTSEILSSRTIKGYRIYEWTKIRERNEALDCRIMARAAAHRLGLDRLSQDNLKRVGDAQTTTIESKDKPQAQISQKKEPLRINRTQKNTWI